MAIVKMKKLRLIALRQQRDELMESLLRLGCIEVRPPDELLSDPETAALLRRERGSVAEARARLGTIQSAVKVLDHYAPAKKKLLSARPEVCESDFLDGEELLRDAERAEILNARDGEIRRIQSEEARLRGELEALEPWLELDEPLNGGGTKRCAMALGGVPLEVDMNAVADAAEAASEAVQLVLVSEDERQHYFVVIALREELSAVTEALRTVGFTPVTFPDKTGTARENADSLRRELAKLAAHREELTESIVQMAPEGAALRLSADRMAAELARQEATERLLGTDSVVVLEGWCPAPETEALEKALESFDCAWELSDPAAEEYPDVPVQLHNGKFAEPMNLVTEMYSLPAYDGIDPNPLMAPFFVLFYGIMMADMGYGLLMMLASWIALKKMKPRGGTKHLLTVLGYSGVSTFVFGALTGGFFGDLLPQIAMMVNPDTNFTALPALFTPLEDPTMILIASLVIGVIQIFTGMIISVRHKCKSGEGLSALFEEGAWWFILIGVALMVLGVGSIGGVPIVLVIGAVLLAVGQFVMKKSFKGGLMGLFGGIYNGVTGYFSDILSYSRLMALMLSGSVIASVFNTLGAMTGNVFAFVLIAMVGNALNLALNLLGCFVHDLRLQVLEFFGRFYKDGGKPFRPLNINNNTQYVEVIKEEM